MSQVKTVEQLRKVLPEPRETTKAKILPFLDEQAIDFLQTCPFGLMATAGRDGPIEPMRCPETIGGVAPGVEPERGAHEVTLRRGRQQQRRRCHDEHDERRCERAAREKPDQRERPAVHAMHDTRSGDGAGGPEALSGR